jgi:hypothetical protein
MSGAFTRNRARRQFRHHRIASLIHSLKILTPPDLLDTQQCFNQLESTGFHWIQDVNFREIVKSIRYFAFHWTTFCLSDFPTTLLLTLDKTHAPLPLSRL